MGGSGGAPPPMPPSLPPPRPKSPPQYPDLYGKRRELAKVLMLEREIGSLEEELKFVEGLAPASGSCKDVIEFVVANSDPFLLTTKKKRRYCRFWKWLCGWSCFNISWICCCGCPKQLKNPHCGECSNPCSECNCCTCCSCPSCCEFPMPKCQCSLPKCQCPLPKCQCPLPKCRCSLPKCHCSMPKCQCCCWPRSKCFTKSKCGLLCCVIPKCQPCSCSCSCDNCSLGCPRCPKVNSCCCCTKNCCCPCLFCF